MQNELLFQMIKELQAERDRLDQAILRVEALASGRARRGRPPKAVAAARKGLRGLDRRREGDLGNNDR
jgi:hypothetical protein